MTDTWTWDGQRWTQLSLPRSPSPRASAGLACDQARGELLLFGGVVSDGFSFKGLQDMWSLRTDDPAAADEQCHTGFDGNDDGKIGCDDADCMAVCARCGDGVCDASESCRSCPVDCEVCAVCGDFHCDPGETCASCPGDCRCSTGAP